ncbi:hypothetical protein Q9L42_016090 [Methylomarinum sp. Ch1-1]|uniref:Uncharacterized protein n=1 Tax=Methylomarinum roseum TaxID=3067653 RepID=A0AAU7NSC6_9GAMM|nr:hypothetical protein [Methylomarinum sp. Ch1-1]MDP4520140.1 hypothetical protein [Methylomarinum sp. Ch1-1]
MNINTLNYASLMILLLNGYQVRYTQSDHDFKLHIHNKKILQLGNIIQNINAQKNMAKHSAINTNYAMKTVNPISSSNIIDTKNIDKEEDLNELYCLALNIYFEARGESEIGKKAVGQ